MTGTANIHFDGYIWRIILELGQTLGPSLEQWKKISASDSCLIVTFSQNCTHPFYCNERNRERTKASAEIKKYLSVIIIRHCSWTKPFDKLKFLKNQKGELLLVCLRRV